MLESLSRRSFLKSAAALAAAPLVVPSSALGRGAVAPSERIVMGGIGIGGRGTADLTSILGYSDVQWAAVCDVRGERRRAGKAVVDQRYGNQDCAAYIDLRELIARPDIDAVLIATGDRWHALASVLAMKAGKDVYCEKPCSLTIAESQAVRDTARRYGRVYQAGTQRRSEEPFLFAALLGRTGLLGRLHTITAHIWTIVPRDNWLPPEPEPSREVVDWDLYLGPALWRPYNHGYLSFYGHAFIHGGTITDWGAHTIDTCALASDTENTAPVEYECPHNETGNGLVARYANGLKLVLTTGYFRGSCGSKVEGSEGWAQCSDGQPPEFEPKSLASVRRQIVQTYLTRTGRSLGHYRDFLDAIKTRRFAAADHNTAHHVHTAVHCSTICVQLQRNLTWDPVKEEFPGDPEANRLRSRALRAPWSL
jgi:predicted dehydrogenase